MAADMIDVPSSPLSSLQGIVVYHTMAGIWVIFLIITTTLFYHYRRHPILVHREFALTMVSTLANAIFTVHYLAKIPLQANYPCLLYLWIPSIFMPLWTLTLLARLMRIIVVYRLGEARLRAAEQAQQAVYDVSSHLSLDAELHSGHADSRSDMERAEMAAGLGGRAASAPAHTDRAGITAANMYDHPRGPAVVVAAAAMTRNKSRSASNQSPPDSSSTGRYPHRNSHSQYSMPNHNNNYYEPTAGVTVDPDRAYAGSVSSLSTHWVYTYRHRLTTQALVQAIMITEVLVLIGAAIFHYIHHEQFYHQPDGTCGNIIAFAYLWVVNGIFILVLAPILIYMARDVRDTWGIRNELILCDLIGLLSAMLYGIFRTTGWNNTTAWPAVLWVVFGSMFVHIWLVARPVWMAMRHRDNSWLPRLRAPASQSPMLEVRSSPPLSPPPSSLAAKPRVLLERPSKASLRKAAASVSSDTRPDSVRRYFHHTETHASLNTVELGMRITLDTVFASPAMLASFRAFCIRELNIESVLFYEAVQQLRRRAGVSTTPPNSGGSGASGGEGWPSVSGHSASALDSIDATRSQHHYYVHASSSVQGGNDGSPLRRACLHTGTVSSPVSSPPGFPALGGDSTLRHASSSISVAGGGSPLLPTSPRTGSRRPPLSRAAVTMHLRNIVDNFIRPGAPYEVGISGSTRGRLLRKVDRGIQPYGLVSAIGVSRELTVGDLDEAVAEVRTQLEHHSLIRFREMLSKQREEETARCEAEMENSAATTPMRRWAWLRR